MRFAVIFTRNARMPNYRLLALRSHRCQPGILFDLDSPSLVIRQMQMQHIHFVESQQINKLAEFLFGDKMARSIEHATTPLEARAIPDGDCGYEPIAADLR